MSTTKTQPATEQSDEKTAAMERILSTLFSTEVGYVVRCRSCGCPVVHMEHLSLDKAKAIEAEVRTMLNIPATFEKYQEEKEAMQCDFCDNTENITTIIDKDGKEPDVHICRDCYATGQGEDL